MTTPSTTTTSPIPPVLDDNFFLYHQGYQLQRVYCDSAGRSIRVRIKRDSYKQQSSAVAEVLTPALTWTTLAEEAPATWHDRSPYATDNCTPKARDAEALVGDLADDLVLRALEVLPYATPVTS